MSVDRVPEQPRGLEPAPIESEPAQSVPELPNERGGERWKTILQYGGLVLSTLPVWVGIMAGADSLLAKTGLEQNHLFRVLPTLAITFAGTLAVGSLLKKPFGIDQPI